MNRRTFLGGCTAAALLLAGCSGVGGPVESGSLDGEQVTHEIDVQAGETVRIEVEGGSLTVARVLGPDGEDLLGNVAAISSDITLTPTAEQTGTHRVVLGGDASYEIYVESE
jgi:hypothetical protein